MATRKKTRKKTKPTPPPSTRPPALLEMPGQLALPESPEQRRGPGAAPASPAGAPQVLAKSYPIVRALGVGGMGETYLAQDPLLGEHCVVKGLLGELKEHPEAAELIQQEALRLYRLKHEGIPFFRDLFQAQDAQGRTETFLVQEFIEGKTLEQLYGHRTISVSESIELLDQVLEILEYLHSRIDPKTGRDAPILHLDIKPENLMLRTADHKILLIDFGISVQAPFSLGFATHETPPVGYTPGYAPEEQRSGRSGPMSDLYALGITALVLLSGQTPEEVRKDLDQGALFAKIQQKLGQAHDEDLPEGLQKLLVQMVEPEGHRRLKSAKEARKWLKSVELDWLQSKPSPWGLAAIASFVVLLALLLLSPWRQKKPGLVRTPPSSECLPSWSPGAFRVLYLPLEAPTRTTKPPQLLQEQAMSIANELLQSQGVLQKRWLSLHRYPRGVAATRAGLHHQEARKLGQRCQADLVLSSVWMAAHGAADAGSAWFRFFATPTGRTRWGPRLQPLHQLLSRRASEQSKLRSLLWAATLLWARRGTRPSRCFSQHLRATAHRHLRRSGHQVPKLDDCLDPTSSMVEIPEGLFVLTKGKKMHLPAFWMDRYEVTRESYAICVARGRCRAIARWDHPPWSLPRDRVAPSDARRYCKSLDKRLPTEAQWIKAARGGLSLANGVPNPLPARSYPWGEQRPTCARSNLMRCYRKLRPRSRLAGLLRFDHSLQGLSPYGVHHMSGNLSEITRHGIVKGGSGVSPPKTIEDKGQMDEHAGLSWVGFRCVKAP